MITRQQRQELISRAHLFAIAARAGLNVWRSEFDYGVDFHLSAVNRDEATGRHAEDGVTFGLQLKCTVDWHHDGDTVVYDLEAKNWNDMVRRHPTRPLFLSLMCLPSFDEEWLTCEEERTVIQHCAYWYSAVGEEITPNTATRRIWIPRRNLMTADSLCMLMETAKAARRPRRRP